MSEPAEQSRIALIVQMLKVNTSASIAEIAENFHVSQMTIRRDLQKLVETGQVIRIPGGARIEHWRGAERSFFERPGALKSIPGQWIQYTAILSSPNGGNSPILNSVILEYNSSSKGKK